MNSDIDINRNYKVQNPKSQSYRLTLPQKFFEVYSMDDISELSIRLSIENEFGVIEYITPTKDELISRKLTTMNNTIRIPSSIGDSLFNDNLGIEWSSTDTDNSVIFSAKTQDKLKKFDTSTWELLKDVSISPVKQSRKVDSGETKNQEHFDIYFNESEKNILGWDNETEIELLLTSVDNKLSLQIKPNTLSSKKITSSGFKQNDARIYIPKSLVRSLEMVNEDLQVFYKGDSVIFKRP